MENSYVLLANTAFVVNITPVAIENKDIVVDMATMDIVADIAAMDIVVDIAAMDIVADFAAMDIAAMDIMTVDSVISCTNKYTYFVLNNK